VSNQKVVRLDEDDGIFTITLDRPEKRNAMNPALHEQMYELLGELRFNPKVRVLIVTGAGESFCAGQDLKEYFYELAEAEAEVERNRSRELSNTWRSHYLRRFPAPTIAKINGWCFGGAFSVVASCDIAIASDEATFGLSEVNFGTAPLGLVTRHLIETLPPRAAQYYALTGKPFSAERAVEIGLVTMAVPKARLDAEVRELAELRSKDPVALRVTKEAFKYSRMMDYEEAYAYSRALASEMTLVQEDTGMRHGLTSFIEGKFRPGLESLKP
jgi:trans-feruloyl-CoA hydratase/vanillin synthase